jgi:CheY-specific phosphatase CheX
LAGLSIQGLREPFVSAASLAIREMTGVEVIDGGNESSIPSSPRDIAALIPLTTASLDGALILRCPEPTAAALARLYLTQIVQEPDDTMIRDCVGEFANVIAGQAKGILSGTPDQFSFAPPDIFADPESSTFFGTSATDASSQGDNLIIVFHSPVGDFVLHVSLHVRESER